MPDVNVSNTQVNVTPAASTLSITPPTPIEISVQQPVNPSFTVESPDFTLEIVQPTTEVFIAEAIGPQGPVGTVTNNAGMTVGGDLTVSNDLLVEGGIKSKIDGGTF